jgi:hypothetical protein
MKEKKKINFHTICPFSNKKKLKKKSNHTPTPLNNNFLKKQLTLPPFNNKNWITKVTTNKKK